MIPDKMPANVYVSTHAGALYWVTCPSEENLSIELNVENADQTKLAKSDKLKLQTLDYISKPGEIRKPEKIRNDCVYFTVHEQEKDSTEPLTYMRVSARIIDLANILDVDTAEIEKAVYRGTLDRLITKRLAGALVSEEPVETPLEAPQPAVEASQIPEIACKIPTWDTGLYLHEYENIKKFYENNITALSSLKEPIHIRKGVKEGDYADQEKLPCSLVFIPQGPQKGLHVLLKTHTDLDELGKGSFNLVTVALHMDSGEPKAYRDGLAKSVRENEREANKELSDDRKHFVAGDFILYIGPFRARTDRECYETKGEMPRQENADKIGFIYDLMTTDLYGRFADPKSPVSETEMLQISLAYGKLIQTLVKRGFVHFDQKLENTSIGPDGKLRLCDFGYTVKIGSERRYCGTRGYVSPELLDARERKASIKADPKADVWQLGCVLADISGSELVYKYLGKHQGRGDLLESLDYDFEGPKGKKEKYLPERHNPNHIHYIIDKCLNADPDKRPTIDEVVEFLEKITPPGGTY
jgi:Protein kinase domain